MSQPHPSQRPVNLDLFAFHFPITAIVSILHRICGVVIFLLLPLLVYLFSVALGSAEGFADVQQWVQHPMMKFVLWCLFSALMFHLVAGVRHLLMDMGFGETIQSGRRAAVITLVLSVLFAAGGAIWLA